MKQMIKRFNILQVISLIGVLITFILIVLDVNNIIHLFWVFIGLHIGGTVMFTDKWSKEGLTTYRKLDKNWNKNLTRKTSETIFFSLIVYTLIVCAIILITTITPQVAENNVWYITLVILTIILDVILLYSVDKTAREVKELEIKKINDSNDRRK